MTDVIEREVNHDIIGIIIIIIIPKLAFILLIGCQIIDFIYFQLIYIVLLLKGTVPRWGGGTVPIK